MYGPVRPTPDASLNTLAGANLSLMAEQQQPRLPYSLELTRYADFVQLETALRGLLQCHGQRCAFLQSAAYVELKLRMVHALNHATTTTTTTEEAAQEDGDTTTLHLPGSSLVLHAAPHLRRVLIHCRAPMVNDPSATVVEEEAAAPAADDDDDDDGTTKTTKKRKRAGEKRQKAGQLTEAQLAQQLVQLRRT